MEIKEEKFEKTIYEVKKTYVANDGTEFKDMEECEKYEATAKCVINEMFNKLNFQRSQCVGIAHDIFTAISSYDDMYAVKIENANQLEIVNKWLHEQDGYVNNYLGEETIGTVQLINEYDDGVWTVGTPERLKEEFSKAIDSLYNKLLEKSEESKGENE